MNNYDNENNLIKKIKDTPICDLQSIADDLRKELIEDVSVSGGHLASNLGVVELTVALHKVFDTPKDKIIWDVGHQCYVHKMITGRDEQMKTIRSFNGLSGFPKRNESVHDMYDSGHSSTSISAALGYASARDIKGEDYSCIAVIGDGALTGGVAFEALNHAGSSKTPLIVILNDNKMSIGKSVGGAIKYLNRLRISNFYINFKKAIKNSKHDLPGLYNFLHNLRDRIKYIFVPDQIFEDFGFKYYGPIDGHDIEELVYELEYAKKAQRPVLVHIITKKGKGFKPAEENPSKFHGIAPFDISTVTSEDEESHNTWSDIFGDEILKLAEKDKSIVAISAAMESATGLDNFKKVYPERVFDVGIAEQHAVSFAAGMALNGLKPVVAIYSTFLQRAYDEILTEVCLQKLPIVFAIDRAGITGADGETHQGMFDIAYLNSMPNMTILNASDKSDFAKLLKYAVELNSPCAIRYGKGNPEFPERNSKVSSPEAIKFREGSDIMFLSDASFVKNTLEAADLLSYSSSVVQLEQLKPLDMDYLVRECSKFRYVITIEDGTKIGGFGSEVTRIISEKKLNCRVLNLGWPDKFIEHGSILQLRNKYGLDANGIAGKVKEFIESQT